MLQSDHYELLDRLRLGKSAEDRHQALNELMIKEQNGEFEQGDMISLLENPNASKINPIIAHGVILKKNTTK